jgi:hypothetical protein
LKNLNGGNFIMATLEQVEMLREHANISYDEAKAALEKATEITFRRSSISKNKERSSRPRAEGQYCSNSIEVSTIHTNGALAIQQRK